MPGKLKFCCLMAICASFLVSRSVAAQQGNSLRQIDSIARRIPPPGIDVPNDKRNKLVADLAAANARLASLGDHPLRPDAEIYIKAVAYALYHGELYSELEIEMAVQALELANKRIDELEGGKTPSWTKEKGLVVRGYRSSIDGSVQPYGLEIPEKLPPTRPPPLYVWLHGRSEETADLQFIQQRHKNPGVIQPPRAMVLHPFGRYCVGFKSAGEIDVIEAVRHVHSQYDVDANSTLLMGFSMGGAGVWHIAAHYPHLWTGASPGAGFVETAEYNNLRKEDYPPDYVQTLWRLYDVPYYARNLLNMPLAAYSGENDKQIQAAQVMEKALLENGLKLIHVIGPRTGHEYEPESLAEIMKLMRLAERRGRTDDPERIFLQTQTLRYNRVPGAEAMGLKEHWQDSRIDGKKEDDKLLRILTKNVTAVRFPLWQTRLDATIEIDGQKIKVDAAKDPRTSMLVLTGDKWAWKSLSDDKAIHKRPGLQGPIDDAFMDSFLVVVPTGVSSNPLIQRWLDFEMKHFENRWRYLFRGDVRLKKDTQITEADAKSNHLILWGDAESNRYLKQVLPKLPIEWNSSKLKVNGKDYDATNHMPLLIYPNPNSPRKYVVLNSGPTFRESHDRSNSLQNPQLPDWAVIDLRETPNDETPGKVVAAGFFDESWQFKK